MAGNANRLRVIGLYRELHRLGREYPDPKYAQWSHSVSIMLNLSSYNFQGRMRSLFESVYHFEL